MTIKDLVLNRRLKGRGNCKTTRMGMINREKEKGWEGDHIKNESKIHNSRIWGKNNIKNKQQKHTDKNKEELIFFKRSKRNHRNEIYSH